MSPDTVVNGQAVQNELLRFDCQDDRSLTAPENRFLQDLRDRNNLVNRIPQTLSLSALNFDNTFMDFFLTLDVVAHWLLLVKLNMETMLSEVCLQRENR
jgi:hypothetical protein